MTTSGSYGINGTDIVTQPTSGEWLPRELIAIDGNQHAVYPLLRNFQMTWQLEDPSDFNQLQTFFDGIGTVGSVVVDLPEYGAATYVFFPYSGCVLREPFAGPYFTEHHTEVRLLVARIRT